jgi:hypothetical protein
MRNVAPAGPSLVRPVPVMPNAGLKLQGKPQRPALTMMIGAAPLKMYLDAIEFSRQGDVITGTICVMAAPRRTPESGDHLTTLCLQDSVDLADIRAYYEKAKAARRTTEVPDATTFEKAARRRIVRVLEAAIVSHPGIVAPAGVVAAGGFLDTLKKVGAAAMKVVGPIAKTAVSAYVGPAAADQVFKVVDGLVKDSPKAQAQVKTIAAEAKAGNPEAKKAAEALRMAEDIRKKAELAQKDLEAQQRQLAQQAASAVKAAAPAPARPVANAPAPVARPSVSSSSPAPSSGTPGGSGVTIVNNITPSGPTGPVATRYQPPPLAAASGEYAGGWVADFFRGAMTQGARG